MTVPINTDPVLRFTGNGTANQFPISFRTFNDVPSDASTIIVKVFDTATETETILVENTDYTLASLGRQGINAELTLLDGADIPMGVSQAWINGGNLAAGYVLFICFSDNAFQPSAFRNLGNISPETFGKTLDRLAMFIVALRERLDRAVYFNEYSTEVDGDWISGEELLERLDALEAALLNIGPGSLPPGGVAHDFLDVAASGLSNEWNSGVFQGYSSRFSQAWDTSGIRETILQILDMGYLGPQVSLSATGSSTIREKGATVTNPTLTAAVTRRTDLIARIQFFIGGVAIAGADYNPPATTGSGNTNHPYVGSFSDNTTFRVDVTDDGASGGPTTVQSSVTYTFVYPYYYGADVPSLPAAQVGTDLTKDVMASDPNVTVVFTIDNGDVIYFAYPASYGALTSILDTSGFETISDWTLRTENITGLDGNAVSYRIYEFNNPLAASSTDYTFIR